MVCWGTDGGGRGEVPRIEDGEEGGQLGETERGSVELVSPHGRGG